MKYFIPKVNFMYDGIDFVKSERYEIWERNYTSSFISVFLKDVQKLQLGYCRTEDAITWNVPKSFH